MAIRITFETVDVEGAESLTPIKILTYDSKGSGITAAGKQALIDLLEKVAYIDEDGQDYLDALEAALFPPANLVSISAVYTQTSSVFAGDDLDDLKDDLVVTAHYDDGSSEVVTTYTLSGELSDNPSIITVSYGGKTTTFSVALTVVSSISAVYTQSGTVYDTDTLDSLKADLVVTATYTDQSTATVASTDYTLSGTLTGGTSTITATYGGKADTFTVTVVLYSIPNGTHDYTGTSDTDYNGRSIAVSGSHHVTYIHSNSTSSKQAGTYAIFDTVSLNAAAGDSANLSGHTDVLFTLPANATVVYELTNIQRTLCSGAQAARSIFASAMRSGSTSIASTGNLSTETSKAVTITTSEATDINLVFVYAAAHVKELEFDVSLTVNGERWL